MLFILLVLGHVYKEVHCANYYQPTYKKPFLAPKCLIVENEDERILQLYESTKKILPGVFAMTESESKLFPNLLTQFIEGERTCDKVLSLCFEEDMRRISSTLTSASCKSRKIRATTNKDNSITTPTLCYKKGDSLLSAQNTVYLADTCSAATDLQVNRYPRYINEIICDQKEGTSCLKNEGIATQLYTTLKFRFVQNNVGKDKLSQWIEYDQRIRSGCSCNCKSGSIFVKLLI